MVRNEVRMMRTSKYETPKIEAISLYWSFREESEKDTQTKGVMCKWGGLAEA